jgi:trans-aconitate methyltransferase
VDPNAAERARWNDDAWTKAWPKREVLTDSVTPTLLAALGLRPGERVLDIGCGGGKATIAASRQVQPGGRPVGADISEALLALARQRAAGTRLATFERADMQVDQVGPNQLVPALFTKMSTAWAPAHAPTPGGGATPEGGSVGRSRAERGWEGHLVTEKRG